MAKHHHHEEVGRKIVQTANHPAKNKLVFKKLNRGVGKLRKRLIGKQHERPRSHQQQYQYKADTPKCPGAFEFKGFQGYPWRMNMLDKA